MIETVLRDYAAAALQVPVFLEIPAAPPARFVVLKRSGAGRERFLENGYLIADSYAESLFEAASLNEKVKSVLDSLDTLDEVGMVQLSADYPVIDTDNKRYRYQAVYEINHY